MLAIAADVSVSGLSPVLHDVTGHGCWSGNRTRNPRLMRSMLYPIELSNDVPDSNRRGQHVADAFPLGQRQVEHRRAPPGIRHGSAARTGRVRTRTAVRCRSVFRIADCRQSAIRVDALRPIRCSSPRHSRRSINTQRPCARCSGAPASDAHGASGCSGAETCRFPQEGNACLRCMCILRERWKQNAPGFCDPRAFASPREIGVADHPGSQPESVVDVPLRFIARMERARDRAVAG